MGRHYSSTIGTQFVVLRNYFQSRTSIRTFFVRPIRSWDKIDASSWSCVGWSRLTPIIYRTVSYPSPSKIDILSMLYMNYCASDTWCNGDLSWRDTV